MKTKSSTGLDEYSWRSNHSLQADCGGRIGGLLSLRTNIASLGAQRNLGASQRAARQSLGRLSSGLRINQAADDAAGLGISENLRADVRSMAQAMRNANDAISMSQVAEGVLGEMHGIVGRMRELAMQAANGTLGDAERHFIDGPDPGSTDGEFGALMAEIDRLSMTAEFNGTQLLDGTASAGIAMQIGIHNTSNDYLALSIGRTTASSLATGRVHVWSTTWWTSMVGTTVVTVTSSQVYSALWGLDRANLSTATSARAMLGWFDHAIQDLSTARARIGAFQNRVESAITNLAISMENLTAADSRVRDADFAAESTALSRNQILSQAGVSVLAQANSLSQSALSLLS